MTSRKELERAVKIELMINGKACVFPCKVIDHGHKPAKKRGAK